MQKMHVGNFDSSNMFYVEFANMKDRGCKCLLFEFHKISDQEGVENLLERDEMNIACSLCTDLKVTNNVKAPTYQGDRGREFVVAQQPNIFKK